MTDLDRQIYREQIRLIYHQGPVLVLGATLCAVLVTVFLWGGGGGGGGGHVPQATLLFWLCAVSITSFLRLLGDPRLPARERAGALASAMGLVLLARDALGGGHLGYLAAGVLRALQHRVPAC